MQKLTKLITDNPKYPLSLTLSHSKSLLSLRKILTGEIKCIKLTFDQGVLSDLTQDLALQILDGFHEFRRQYPHFGRRLKIKVLGWLDKNLAYLLLRIFDGAEKVTITNDILPSSFYLNETGETSITLTRLDLSYNCKFFLDVRRIYHVTLNVNVLRLNERSLAEVNALLLPHFTKVR